MWPLAHRTSSTMKLSQYLDQALLRHIVQFQTIKSWDAGMIVLECHKYTNTELRILNRVHASVKMTLAVDAMPYVEISGSLLTSGVCDTKLFTNVKLARL